MIRFEDVTKTYDGQARACADTTSPSRSTRASSPSWSGASGSGKSTFLRLILREYLPTSGHIYVAGKDLNRLHSWKVPALRRQIGTVFQDFRLLPGKTVTENVAFAMQVIGKPAVPDPQVVPETLELVGLEGKGDRLPEELSGGEQQRVAIARAFVNRPTILIADEPTGNLDPTTSVGIMKLLDRINRAGHHGDHGHPRRDHRRPDAQARHRTRRRRSGPRPEQGRLWLPVSRRGRRRVA